MRSNVVDSSLPAWLALPVPFCASDPSAVVVD